MVILDVGLDVLQLGLNQAQLAFQTVNFRLQLRFLYLQLCCRGLVFFTGGVRCGTGCQIVGTGTGVVFHDFPHHVDAGDQFTEAVRGEQQLHVHVGEAFFLHAAHVLAVQHQHVVRVFLGDARFLALLLNQLTVHGQLFLDEVDFLNLHDLLLVQRGFALHEVGFFVLQRFHLGFLCLDFLLEGGFFRFFGIDLRLRDRVGGGFKDR